MVQCETCEGWRLPAVDFYRAIDRICGRFDEAELHYALIGGFAMAMRGVQRATVDLDFLLLLDDLGPADDILRDCGYERAFRSDNVSHYRSPASDFGRIDILHAFRTPSLGMLDRASRIEVGPGLSLPVAQAEDIIGLKVQAAVNDPERASADWQDIEMLVRASAHQGGQIDWDLVADYLEIFDQPDRLNRMREWHGETD